ncbi:MAG TPA: PKD domain-containing protein, partial [Bacteroidales bacterium]|nr:PKD domain-containing protein [Bacteroidales bacterium]
YQWQLLITNESDSPLVFYFDKDLNTTNSSLGVELTEGTQKRFQQIVLEENLPLVYGPVYGDQIVFELTVEDSTGVYLALNEIGVLFKDAYGFGTSGDCEVNVNCDEGASLTNQKQGVARILVKKGSGLFYCSGSLINNTRRDFAPLFLTANHCGQNATEADYARWIFAFNYEAEGCEDPNTEPIFQTLTGARLLAQSSDDVMTDSDFKLLSLLQDVPQHFRPYFNGWNRENTTSAAGHVIHHPDGDIKKISTYAVAPLSTFYQGGTENPEAPYWRVVWAETGNGHGVTEGGSSGSPLFDNNGLIMGTLTGGLATCDSPSTPDYFGKFSFSWSENGTTPGSQLAPWLDPEHTGVTRLSGLGYDPEVLIAYFVSQHRDIVVGQEVSFANLSSGNILDYEWFFEGGQPEKSDQKDPGMISYHHTGSYDVILVVSNESASDTLVLDNYIKVSNNIFPNPAASAFTLDFGKEFPENPQLFLFDMRGREIDFSVIRSDNKLIVNPTNF